LSNSNSTVEGQTGAGTADDSRTRLTQWLNGLRIDHIAYNRAATYYNQRNRALGLVVTVLSVFVGTSLFTGLASSKNLEAIVLIAGVISAATAVLTGTQTFLNYGELAEKSRSAAYEYGALRRKVEVTMVAITDEQKLADAMTDIGKQWNQLDSEAPLISQSIYSAAESEVRKKSHLASIPPKG
jgi:hypothetical protein